MCFCVTAQDSGGFWPILDSFSRNVTRIRFRTGTYFGWMQMQSKTWHQNDDIHAVNLQKKKRKHFTEWISTAKFMTSNSCSHSQLREVWSGLKWGFQHTYAFTSMCIASRANTLEVQTTDCANEMSKNKCNTLYYCKLYNVTLGDGMTL